jgi:hypothetical protein
VKPEPRVEEVKAAPVAKPEVTPANLKIEKMPNYIVLS